MALRRPQVLPSSDGTCCRLDYLAIDFEPVTEHVLDITLPVQLQRCALQRSSDGFTTEPVPTSLAGTVRGPGARRGSPAPLEPSPLSYAATAERSPQLAFQVVKHGADDALHLTVSTGPRYARGYSSRPSPGPAPQQVARPTMLSVWRRCRQPLFEPSHRRCFIQTSWVASGSGGA